MRQFETLPHVFFLHFDMFTSTENLPDGMSRFTLSFAYASAKNKKQTEISSINLNWALMFAAWMRRLRLQRLFPGIKTLNTWIFLLWSIWTMNSIIFMQTTHLQSIKNSVMVFTSERGQRTRCYSHKHCVSVFVYACSDSCMPLSGDYT